MSLQPPAELQGEPENKAMFKMLIAAWQNDATRVVTYRMPDAGLLQSMAVGCAQRIAILMCRACLQEVVFKGSPMGSTAPPQRRTRRWLICGR